MTAPDPRTQTHTCCLCGTTFTGWGNNPDPLGDHEDDRCCDDCNANKVIPARLVGMSRNKPTA